MKYNIKEIALTALQMTQNLKPSFMVVPFGQGLDMSPPRVKELMKLTLEERIAHSGHPVLRWMMDNIYVKTDPAGNTKPDKEKSTERNRWCGCAYYGARQSMPWKQYPHSVYDEGVYFEL